MNYKINQNEKIFIAGGRGMVGSAIIRALLKNGYKNNSDSNIFFPNREELDLTNYDLTEKWFEKHRPTIVIIAAAKVGGIHANNSDPYDFILNNLKIQTNLIEISFKFKIKTLLFLGSSCIYPKFAKQPIKEEYLLTGSLEKTNEFYALAKIAGIKLCQSLKIQHNFNSICLMPTNLYGPGDNYNERNSHVIPALIRKIYNAKINDLKSVKCWGSGQPLREFLYVDDLAEACLYILGIWNSELNMEKIDADFNQIFWLNVGSDFEVSINELANMISETIGYKGKIIWDSNMPDGTPRKKLDTSLINNIGWHAKTNLKNGLRKTFNHFVDEISNNTIRN